MIKKYHNHKLQTNPWHRKEESHNNHETPERQTKQKKTSYLFPIKMIAKLVLDTTWHTKQKTITDTHNGSNNQQRMNSNRTDSSLSHWGLNAFYWYQIFALDHVVDKAQKCKDHMEAS